MWFYFKAPLKFEYIAIYENHVQTWGDVMGSFEESHECLNWFVISILSWHLLVFEWTVSKQLKGPSNYVVFYDNKTLPHIGDHHIALATVSEISEWKPRII